MKKSLKQISMMLVLVLFVTVYASLTAMAANEKRFDSKNGSYVTISNVVEVKKIEDVGYGETMYVATAPVKVTFHGKLSDESEIAQWFEDDDGLNIIDIKNGAATLTELTRYGVFPVFAGEDRGDNAAILLQVVASTTTTSKKEGTKSESLSTAPTAAKVLVNGKAVSFEAYNIDNNNYFKLRDLAMAINASEKNFAVDFDGTLNAISLTSNKAYTPQGNELVVSSKLTTKQATATMSKVYLNGEEVQFTAYNIDGSNYFKLRDVAKVINFGVFWDAGANSIGIDTSSVFK
jgi:hypothetical protein